MRDRITFQEAETWGVTGDQLAGRVPLAIDGELFRVVRFAPGVSTAKDSWLIIPEGHAARLAALARRLFDRIHPRAVRLDKRIYRWAGKPLVPGSFMPRRSLTQLLVRLHQRLDRRFGVLW